MFIRDRNNVEGVIEEVTEVLATSYPNAEFTFEDAGSKMEAAEASNQILTMLLSAMAAIVFVVGGSGIMNVLFVSVKERTNEIGILKAIGCSKRDIPVSYTHLDVYKRQRLASGCRSGLARSKATSFLDSNRISISHSLAARSSFITVSCVCAT